MNKRKNFIIVIMIIFMCFLFGSCEIGSFIKESDTQQTNKTDDTKEKPQKESKKEVDKISILMDNMSLREKVGQLFIIRPDALYDSLTEDQISNSQENGVKSLTEEMSQTLKDYPVGGFAIFDKNISTPYQIKTFTSQLKSSEDITPFIAVDEEGGIVSRLANHSGFDLPRYKNVKTIGDTKDPENARRMGQTIGKYLIEYGFNLDFAPDADVNTNPNNPVIGSRAFSSNPKIASEMVSAAVEGFHESGIMTCIKHFPGHGDTNTDSHNGYTSTNKTWKQMLSCEILPFKAGIASGTDMIMVSHITAVNVTSDGLPSSLSYEMVTGKQRDELCYDGVIITDSLSMGAITNKYSSSEAAVKAFLAGNDILLMPYNYKQAFDGVLSAVENKTISESRLDESVRRILSLKQKYGLLN